MKIAARLLAASVLLAMSIDIARAAELQFIQPDERTHTSQAVIVERVPLVHTGQFFGGQLDGAAIFPGVNWESDVDCVFKQLAVALGQAGGSPKGLVKLNVYVTRQAFEFTSLNQEGIRTLSALRAAIAEKLRAVGAKPAVSYVVSNLSSVWSGFGMDAVAAVPQPKNLRGEDFAILPTGPIIYLSGDAKPGDLATATTETLKSLESTLKHLGRTKTDIVQLKCFFKPMKRENWTVRQEIDRFFAPAVPPPVVMVEWSDSNPIEIELIAADRRDADKKHQPLEFVTPPGMKPSPVFSRVARVDSPKLIYISGLTVHPVVPTLTGEGEVRAVFAQLSDILKASGSDFQHLAKATYYCTNADVTKALGAIRPEFYNPDRPPAASRATVSSVGAIGRTLSIDMIAVPK